MMSDPKTPLKLHASPSEQVRDVAMALVGCIPGFGSMAQLMVGEVWKDPRYRAINDFAEKVAGDLHNLRNELPETVQEILRKPETQPLLFRAFEEVSKSIGEKKLEALRGAAVQGIFLRSYKFDLSVIVFSLLERVTEGHLIMLNYIKDQSSAGIVGLTLDQLSILGLEYLPSIDHLQDKERFISNTVDGTFFDRQIVDTNELIASDLIDLGLISTNVIGGGTFDGKDTRPFALTQKAKLFLDYVIPSYERGA